MLRVALTSVVVLFASWFVVGVACAQDGRSRSRSSDSLVERLDQFRRNLIGQGRSGSAANNHTHHDHGNHDSSQSSGQPRSAERRPVDLHERNVTRTPRNRSGQAGGSGPQLYTPKNSESSGFKSARRARPTAPSRTTTPSRTIAPSRTTNSSRVFPSAELPLASEPRSSSRRPSSARRSLQERLSNIQRFQ